MAEASCHDNKGKRKQLELASASKAPPMKVISATELGRIGRIPKRTKNNSLHAVKALDVVVEHGSCAAKRPGAVLVFVSHRWLSPHADSSQADADDRRGSKARALVEWAKWFKWALKVGERVSGLPTGELTSHCKEVYFWIDQACVNQDDPAPHMAALPVYAACSHLTLCYHTHDYDGRAWCQVERMISYVYCSTGDMLPVVRQGFLNKNQSVAQVERW
eukprot:CAMPEP_0196585234 /NCGR_PEP_ID=MMETSP1081-20130531/49960_1 /TAXON_ID=36882 /ORGANISM="Pyramimonas amylifera, Strain CCMP720" /LENGTH=218 /DNA_ID=CAMNT_0041906711 /DNA_START=365 /DNA_END=1019 /DNA_ORIENTATION=-